MESRINQLLEKYWAGETTLQEEKELKSYFRKNPSLTPTGLFFQGLDQTATQSSSKAFTKPGGWFQQTKYAVAATITLGIIVGALILRDSGRQHDFEITDPQQAYEIAQTVLGSMSASINEAKQHTLQLKKLNKAENIIKQEQL